MPRVIHDPAEWRAFCRSLRAYGGLGFVPTMGALHAGHLSLCRQAIVAGNANVVVSIFVNPTQFNDQADLAAYPRVLEADLHKLASVGVTAVFAPAYDGIYPDSYRFRMSEVELSRLYCGAHRPGHFDGVLTVVLKLLQLTGADAAYFGEKDYQQYMLVRDMAAAFFVPTAIVPCPIVREANGLAMSSRNERLSLTDRVAAGAFHRALVDGTSADQARQRLLAAGFEVDYVADIADAARGIRRRIAAIRFSGIRLIDNIGLTATGEATDV
ncbi:MAG: pantoate--beta-alanine ligase [Spirochaetes bacterium GWD1_61_31]|nr:MAG: pantoate--beta-alanine ligase [Spirochaetes bacterium GWB1_60_80]OHD29793.1 MAG: pantoate--beta-alanine ligase [Spirochaetes bacterium GWC1_61_12]OHD42929.1 MAG: pantoate--beta-alanine ligase [Spirochaetes bacterium GWE1_60_18]OHD43490.1 MAG: pantoate--beta-alanine ligase [Spirochaetes bacterium GWD1_61_31]OHD59607.1 MAG: pantoate--beta-alanine ligase [Spirochaetes bacterium GWF1_60_12]HAP43755.1 pantoate--beta-alanine ligase [Spirochaetaceae bacterium]